MGKVLTINFKKEFPETIETSIVNTTKVKVDGLEDTAQTKFQPLNENLGSYDKYKIQFVKKCNIGGFTSGIEFESFLRKYESYAYNDSENDYMFTIGACKGIIPRSALSRLKRTTPLKCEAVGINLVQAIPLLVESGNDITINSGWFSNLGGNLRNAWLQGQEVNTNPDWIRFRETNGSSLKNIELRIEDDDFSSGYILMSLSSRAFLHTNSTISDARFLEIANQILEIIGDAIEVTEIIEEDI